MKKIFDFWLILLTVAIVSCKEEELTGIPALPPRITNTSPEAIVANLGADLSATVTDGANSPVASVQFEILNEAGSAILSRVFNEAFSEGPNNLTWTVSESKINEMPAGDYKLKITATDTKNKVSVSQANLKVLAINPECLQVGKVTIVLLAPNPPAGGTIGFVGSPTNWGSAPGTDVVFNKVTNGVFCAAVTMQAGSEYKFRLDENWATEEGKLDGNCSGGNNRQYSGSGNDLIVQQVPVWRPCP